MRNGSGSRRGSQPDALADHEEQIRLLKEQIALKMKAKEASRMRAKRDGSTGSEGTSRTGSETAEGQSVALGLERGERAGSPLKQEVTGDVVEMEVETTEIRVVVAADEVRDPDARPLPDVPASATGEYRPS